MADEVNPTTEVGNFEDVFRVFLEGLANFCTTKCRHYKVGPRWPRCSDKMQPGCILSGLQKAAMDAELRRGLIKRVSGFTR
jgi:hypothetical protein